MIKNVIFDIGQVLVDFQWQAHMRNLGFSEQTIATLDEKWVGGPMWEQLDLGVISESEALEMAKQTVPECAEEIQIFWDNPDGIIRCREQAVPWLKMLKERGYGVYLLSNYPRSLFEAHSKDLEFLPYTDGMVVSCYVKMMKPDAGIYEELLRKYSLSASECVFIDDRVQNIDAAVALGMKGIVLQSAEQAMNDLEQLLKAENQS